MGLLALLLVNGRSGRGTAVPSGRALRVTARCRSGNEVCREEGDTLGVRMWFRQRSADMAACTLRPPTTEIFH